MVASELTVTASQLIVTASEFVDVKLKQPAKEYLLVALRHGIVDIDPQGIARRGLLLFFHKNASPSLRLSIVNVLVDDVLSKYQVPPVRHQSSFPLLWSQARTGSYLHELVTETGLHKKNKGNDWKLDALKYALVGSRTAKHSVLRCLVLADLVAPLLPILEATGIGSKSNLLLFVTVLYLLFYKDGDEVLREAVGKIPDAVVKFIGSIEVSARVLPAPSRLEDCKMALICLNEFGPVAGWDEKVYLPLLKLLVEDGGRLVIACDIHRLIKNKLDRESYETLCWKSYDLPKAIEVGGGEEQEAVYTKLRSNLIYPRRYRFCFRVLFRLELVLAGYIVFHRDLDGLPPLLLWTAGLFLPIFTMYCGYRSKPSRLLRGFVGKWSARGLALLFYSMILVRFKEGTWGRCD
jgi:hypothetical protein